MRAADTELFRDKIELSLDGKQVFYLFFGGAVLASMVFVLGVMVGKRVEARSHVDSQADTSAHLDPLAALDKLDAHTRSKDLAFRGALSSGKGLASLGAVDERLAPAVAAPAEHAASGAAAHDGADQSGQPGKEKDGAAAATSVDEKKASPAEDKKARPAKDDKAKGAEPALARADKSRSDVATDEPATKDSAKAEPVATDSAAAAASNDGGDQATKKFTLQLSSFQDENEASAFVEQLKQAGYRPYVRRADVDGTPWYRVRIGRYASFDDAVDAKSKFEQDRGIIAYVTRL